MSIISNFIKFVNLYKVVLVRRAPSLVFDRRADAPALEESDVNMRDYAKYLLKEGSTTERHDLLTNLKSRITIANKKLTLLEEQK